jgi:hypothetical protein
MPDLISGRVRAVFRDASSGYTVLREIDRIWQSEGFAPGIATINGGQRVTLWSEYESSVDWTNRGHVNRVIRVYESFLSEFVGDDTERFTRVLSLDGWAVDDQRRITATALRLDALSGLDQLRDGSGIIDAFRRIDLLLDDDPAGVVGAVKELIESTAKTVLEHLNEPFAANDDIPALVTKTQQALGLAVSNVDTSLDSSDSVKKILGGLKGIAIGITELRNAEGSGHGRTRASNLTARHARLAVNAGRAWCEIVLDTFGDESAPWRTRGGAPSA